MRGFHPFSRRAECSLEQRESRRRESSAGLSLRHEYEREVHLPEEPVVPVEELNDLALTQSEFAKDRGIEDDLQEVGKGEEPRTGRCAPTFRASRSVSKLRLSSTSSAKPGGI
jgi:hypothetical protein